jgi:uncharacterized protein
MRIPVDEITQSAKEVHFSERIEDLNQIYAKGQARDYEFPPCLDVDLVYYRCGADIFFQGSFAAQLGGRCSRCLEQYSFNIDKEFDLVLTPDPLTSGKSDGELNRNDLGLSYYSSEEINLAPLIKEQVLLALPTRPLCQESCRGLCGTCGANLNRESCGCFSSTADPRMALFRTLKLNR